uniref:Proteasome subunit alpha type-4-like n=1 Tax=Dermatophagoides pteronyssinus TaxID=6956 RepID=A0A6P6Y7D8_DERPT|nr:proteasome subunit alpha type-4-like [Dermatophagoides pteronyssinus]
MTGYDNATTIFSPDGHLRQVRNASEAARKGSSVVALTGEGCIVIVSEKRLKNQLQNAATNKKIKEVNKSVVAVFAGLSADGVALVNLVRDDAAYHLATSDVEADAKFVAERVASTLQRYTIKGRVRPFGIIAIIAGFDFQGIPHVYKCETHGIYSGWDAAALGANEETIQKYLVENYKKNQPVAECVKIGLNAASKVIDCSPDFIDVLIITHDAAKKANVLKYLTPEELKAYSVSDTTST